MYYSAYVSDDGILFPYPASLSLVGQLVFLIWVNIIISFSYLLLPSC